MYRSASTPCAKSFTQGKHAKYARAVYSRTTVSKRAKKRLVTMRRCQHSHQAKVNARRLVRRVRNRWKARKAYTAPGGASPIPHYIVACESGGSYTAVNPSSGAYGKYQIMPFHWSSGICRDLDRSPRGQDLCAARIWESSGPGAWDCA